MDVAWLDAALRGDVTWIEAHADQLAGTRDENGETALMLATRRSDIPLIQALIGREARLQNDEGCTALMLAALADNGRACAILAPHEADVVLADGRDALILAAQVGNLDAIHELVQVCCLIHDCNQLTALDHSTNEGHLDSVRLIVRAYDITPEELEYCIIIADERNYTAISTYLHQVLSGEAPNDQSVFVSNMANDTLESGSAMPTPVGIGQEALPEQLTNSFANGASRARLLRFIDELQAEIDALREENAAQRQQLMRLIDSGMPATPSTHNNSICAHRRMLDEICADTTIGDDADSPSGVTRPPDNPFALRPPQSAEALLAQKDDEIRMLKAINDELRLTLQETSFAAMYAYRHSESSDRTVELSGRASDPQRSPGVNLSSRISELDSPSRFTRGDIREGSTTGEAGMYRIPYPGAPQAGSAATPVLDQNLPVTALSVVSQASSSSLRPNTTAKGRLTASGVRRSTHGFNTELSLKLTQVPPLLSASFGGVCTVSTPSTRAIGDSIQGASGIVSTPQAFSTVSKRVLPSRTPRRSLSTHNRPEPRLRMGMGLERHSSREDEIAVATDNQSWDHLEHRRVSHLAEPSIIAPTQEDFDGDRSAPEVFIQNDYSSLLRGKEEELERLRNLLQDHSSLLQSICYDLDVRSYIHYVNTSQPASTVSFLRMSQGSVGNTSLQGRFFAQFAGNSQIADYPTPGQVNLPLNEFDPLELPLSSEAVDSLLSEGGLEKYATSLRADYSGPNGFDLGRILRDLTMLKYSTSPRQSPVTTFTEARSIVHELAPTPNGEATAKTVLTPYSAGALLMNLSPKRAAVTTRCVTPLMSAVCARSLDDVRANLHYAGRRNEAGETALMMAVELAFTEAVSLLIEKEAGVVSKQGTTALMIAIQMNNLSVAKLLRKAEGLPTDRLNGRDGMTTELMLAAEANDIVGVFCYLDSQVRMVDAYGRTALWYAASAARFEAARLLYKREAGVVGHRGETALMIAACVGSGSIVRLLAHREAQNVGLCEPNIGEPHTALMCAAYNGHVACAQILTPLEHAILTPSGRGALEFAAAPRPTVPEAVRNEIIALIQSFSE
ncbi:Ankyrin repeat protein 1 [Giardia muris]|uniref:Ankyrin repeat protein 1 n=1 Tax=Giardia muris TaxID=5742 RepID=A0A4Z1T1E7_GIAMU|nr:Ankyrin repeat protein 1 [Giardia muris]|eukprot:TNJ27743.1 Ankyrin repeat protein 1 [Giardia muris]